MKTIELTKSIQKLTFGRVYRLVIHFRKCWPFISWHRGTCMCDINELLKDILNVLESNPSDKMPTKTRKAFDSLIRLYLWATIIVLVLAALIGI